MSTENDKELAAECEALRARVAEWKAKAEQWGELMVAAEERASLNGAKLDAARHNNSNLAAEVSRLERARDDALRMFFNFRSMFGAAPSCERRYRYPARETAKRLAAIMLGKERALHLYPAPTPKGPEDDRGE